MTKMEKEKTSLISGYLMAFVILLLIGFAIWRIAGQRNPLYVLTFLQVIFCMLGFVVINPNESVVLILFGDYKGTIKRNGFYWVNPFFVKRKISLRAHNFDSQTIKVNDKLGNPIMIGVVLVWKVENTYKAAFEVDQYME